MRRGITIFLLLLLVIPLLSFRVHALPTTNLTFEVFERDYNQYYILDFEGNDDIDYSYTIIEDDPDGALNFDSPSTSTDYAYSGSHSLKFRAYGDISADKVYSITLIYTFSPKLHSIFYRYIIESLDSGGYTNITIYVDGSQIKFDSVSGTTKDSDWLEIDKKSDLHGFYELKIVVETFEDVNYVNVVDVCKFYIDYGRRFKDVIVEKSLTVEYWSERIEVDKYRVHYTLDSSQLTGTWWNATLEGDYYLEEGNGERLEDPPRLILYPGSSEWKFYRDYTESSYPHSHYFVIFRFDNGTLCNSTITINFGTSEEDVSNWLWYKEKSQITQEFYTVKNGSDWYRHFRIHPSVTAYVPTPEDTYSFITFNIHDYTGEFTNSSLLVYDTQSRLIQEELITSTYQGVCYLKAYGSYLLVIKKDTEERVIGWIVVDSAEKDIYIGVLPPSYTTLFKDVKYSVEDDETNTQMIITLNGSSPFNYKIEIYKNNTLEFSKEGSGVTTVSITYDYDTTGLREVHITITDPETEQSMTRIHYTGRAIEQMPSPPDRIPLITQLLNNTVMNQLQQYASIGLENIIAYLLAISVFLLLATKYSLGAGMIGSGIVIIFVKAYLGSVTAFPDLMISTIIIFGGIYELTKKR